jgi:hypothetical protein
LKTHRRKDVEGKQGQGQGRELNVTSHRRILKDAKREALKVDLGGEKRGYIDPIHSNQSIRMYYNVHA